MTKEYNYAGKPEIAGSAKSYRMQRLCTIKLPVAENAEELARLFRRIPAEKFAHLCVMSARTTGGDVKRMTGWFYAATLFSRLRKRRERQEMQRKAALSGFHRELEERYEPLQAGQYMRDLLGIK